MAIVGITDHTPLPDHRWPEIRMHLNELPDYVESIQKARDHHPDLTVLSGMECEYEQDYHAFFEDELLNRHCLDYLIGSVHFYRNSGAWAKVHGGIQKPSHLVAYATQMIATMESGLFAFIAHPDLFGNSYLTWDKNTESCTRDILQAAVSLKMPLEINGYGFRKESVDTPQGRRPMYPWEPFWSIAAEYPIQVVVNSDAHRPEDVLENISDGWNLAKKYSLESFDISPLLSVRTTPSN